MINVTQKVLEIKSVKKIKINILINHLLKGGVCALSTDTIVGLSCVCDNAKAIAKILKLKKRQINKGLILLCSDISQIKPYINPNIDNNLLIKINKNHKRPTTWLIPANKKTSRLITGNNDTVAVRLTKNKNICATCNTLKKPIISTSANIEGYPPAQNNLELKVYFKNNLDFIYLTDTVGNSQPSQIINITNDQILRK